jgi:hypothetical protein
MNFRCAACAKKVIHFEFAAPRRLFFLVMPCEIVALFFSVAEQAMA